MKKEKEKLERPITLEQREQILNKLYLKPIDIYLLIDGIGIQKASQIAKDMCKRMEEKKLYDPSKPTDWDGKSRRSYLVNTELFRKEMKI